MDTKCQVLDTFRHSPPKADQNPSNPRTLLPVPVVAALRDLPLDLTGQIARRRPHRQPRPVAPGSPGLPQGLPLRENLAKSVLGGAPLPGLLPSGPGLTASVSGPEGPAGGGGAGAYGRTRGSTCRVRRNPESRPPILGSSRAGATPPPEPPVRYVIGADTGWTPRRAAWETVA